MKTELTPAQKLSNRILDLEIAEAEKHNKRQEEEHQLKMKEWAEFREKALKENPNQWIPLSYPSMDMSAPRRVRGVRYV